MKSVMRSQCCGVIAFFAIIPCAFADDVSYTYDALGRLVRVEYVNGSTVVYDYDAAGNRTSVEYGAVDSAPTAVNDSVAVKAKVAKLFDPRANDSDPDNDPLTIDNQPGTTPTTPAHGTVAVNSGQTITYTPASTFPSGASGTDSFSYRISDGHGNTATATVNLTVTNDPPVANNDTIATAFNTPLAFNPRSNDYDVNGDTLSITSPGSTAIATTIGSVTGTSTTITYTPTNGLSGADHFTYTISDGHTNTATATVNVTVSPENRAPVAVNDSGNFSASLTSPNTVVPSVTLDPRAGTGADSDPDGDPLSIISITQPVSHNATAAIYGGGTSVTYTYNTAVHNLETTDSFTYTISDGHNHTATATITITIFVETGQ